jgi:hypothetical protein
MTTSGAFETVWTAVRRSAPRGEPDDFGAGPLADQSNGRRFRNKKTQSIDSDDGAVWNDLDQDIVSIDNFDGALAGFDLDETAIERDVANGDDLSRAGGEYGGAEGVR